MSKKGPATLADRSPDERRAIARKGAAARHSLDAYIRSIVNRAPELTPAQRAQLAAILLVTAPADRPTRTEGRAA